MVPCASAWNFMQSTLQVRYDHTGDTLHLCMLLVALTWKPPVKSQGGVVPVLCHWLLAFQQNQLVSCFLCQQWSWPTEVQGRPSEVCVNHRAIVRNHSVVLDLVIKSIYTCFEVTPVTERYKKENPCPTMNLSHSTPDKNEWQHFIFSSKMQ